MKVLLTALAVLAIVPATARAQQSDSLTRSTTGHGTITAQDAPVCTTPGSTPESVQANCTAISAGQFGGCPLPNDNRPGNCGISLTAVAPPGWQFVNWTGNRCSGTVATQCGFPVLERICDGPEGACRVRLLGPFTVIAHFIDVRRPTIDEFTGPGENTVVISDTRRQTFTFNTDEDHEAPTFECQFDGGAFTACTSPRVLNGLTDGVHDFCVKAKDASGKASLNEPCKRWEQQTAPTAAITARPDAVTRSTAADFTYTSNKTARRTFECSLDNGPFEPCAADGVRLAGLADGAHRFSVRAVFRGALDGPAVRRLSAVAAVEWTIDSTAPETTITAGPADGSVISDISPTFEFAAGEPGSTFTCGIDGGPAAPCTSPFTTGVLVAGPHTVTVTATDAIGNADPTPATRAFSLAVLLPAPTDRDRDGYPAELDCDDGDATINPGAPEIPGNRVDEDCDGVAAPFAKVLALVTTSGDANGRQTVFNRFLVSEIPPGGTVEVRCSATPRKACPFARRTLKVTKKGTANGLTRTEKRRGLAFGVGATVDVRIVAPRMIGRVRRFKIVKRVYPKGQTLCLAPGTTKPAKCPA